MASAAFSPAAAAAASAVHHEQGLCRQPKMDVQAHLPSSERIANKPPSGVILISEYKVQTNHVLAHKAPVNVDGPDAQPDAALFISSLAQRCIQLEQIYRFLKHCSEDIEEEDLNKSLLSDALGLQGLGVVLCQPLNDPIVDQDYTFQYESIRSSPLIDPQSPLYLPDGFLDAFEGSPSKLTRNLLVRGFSPEMKDLLLAVSEFNMPEVLSYRSKQPMLVPYFRRWKNKRANTEVSSSNSRTQTLTPTKSPGTIKIKQLSKKKRKNSTTERERLGRSPLLGWETLMTFLMNLKGGQVEVIELKKSGADVSEFLMQLSAGIAGAGLAVILKVILNVYSRKSPFCAVRLWNTGFGCALVWISLAVQGFRGTIINITRNSSKLKFKEEKVIEKVQVSLNKVLFRSGALLVLTLLRFA